MEKLTLGEKKTHLVGWLIGGRKRGTKIKDFND